MRRVSCTWYKLNGEVVEGGSVCYVKGMNPWATLHNTFFVDNCLNQRFIPGDVLALDIETKHACRLVARAECAKYPSTDDGFMVNGVFEPKYFGRRPK